MQHYIVLTRPSADEERGQNVYYEWEYAGSTAASSPQEAARLVAETEYTLDDDILVYPLKMDEDNEEPITYTKEDLP